LSAAGPAAAQAGPPGPPGPPDPGGAADLLTSLVGIDSQNPRLAPGAAGETPLAEFCADWLRQHGVNAWLDEVEPGRHNAVARIGDGSPVLTLCAHLDTVSAAGMSEPPFEARVAEGRLYGRGAYDMKGGVAAIMLAMARLASDPPRGTVYAALVVDEEYASSGAIDFVRRYRSDACIVTEPSEGRLILAHKGFAWVKLVTRGVAAHGSRWQDGVSAVARMGRIIAALDRFDREELRLRQQHPLMGPASLHCAIVDGGTGWSTYAERCELSVERRTLPGEPPEQVLQEIAGVVAAAGEDAELTLVLSRPPLECDPASAVAVAVRSAAADAAGEVPADSGVAYWMDTAVFAEAGAATVNYGPAGAGAHSAVEWVDLASVERCATVLEGAARRYCR
jgi:acetylornithine deacetylase